MKKLYTFYVVHCSVDERKYVGCTSYSLEKRWGDHVSATKTGARTPFHKEMHEIGIENFKPEMICQEYHDRKSAVIREEEFISHYNSRDNGFNGSWSRVGESNGWYGKGASNDNFTDPSKNPSKGVIQKTAKKVDVEGVTYPSIAHAARAYNIDHALVTYRVKSKSLRFKNWNYHGG